MFVIDTEHFSWNRGVTYQMDTPVPEKGIVWFRGAEAPVCDAWVPADGVCKDNNEKVHSFGGYYERVDGTPPDAYCKLIGRLRFAGKSKQNKNKLHVRFLA